MALAGATTPYGSNSTPAVASSLLCGPAGDLKLAQPKTLCYRLWHVAGRITRHARRLIVRLTAPGPGPPT